MIAHVGQEMFHRAQQEVAETPALRVHRVQPLPGEQAGEELLGEVARRFFVWRVATHEGKYRRVVGTAQFRQGRLCFRRVTARLQHPRPLRRGEDGRRCWRCVLAGRHYLGPAAGGTRSSKAPRNTAPELLVMEKTLSGFPGATRT